ncbi:MAG: hypothetical protein JWN04_2226 [Myxococcaceae bacterium]|nr:hypothetical protein [Myxococcaceae bacterium]
MSRHVAGLVVVLWSVLGSLSLHTAASAQAPAVEPVGTAAVEPVPLPEPTLEPAVVPAPPSVPVLEPPAVVAPLPAVVPLPPVRHPVLTPADAWVLFEQQRDLQTARAEKLFFPLALGLQAGLGVGLAAVSDAPAGSRIALGVAGGLAAASILPTMLSSTRDGSRAWFGAGSAAFALGVGASLIALDLQSRHNDEGARHADGRFLGSAVALQGLVMLPIGLIQGFPSAEDYAAYARLPLSARPEAAARILRQIDRYEQRTTGFVLLGNLAAALVLTAGIVADRNRQDRTEMAALSFAPLGTALLAVVPRLFTGSRVERLAVGEAPRRMAFNAW